MKAARLRIATLFFVLPVAVLMTGCAISRQKTTRPSPAVVVVQKVEAISQAEIIAQIQAGQDEIWIKGNLDVMDEGYTADAVIHTLQGPDMDIDARKEYIAAVRSQFSDCRVIMHEAITEGDKRFSRWTWEGKVRGPNNVIRQTFQDPETGESQTVSFPIPIGTKFSLQGCSVFRLVEGKAAEEWQYMDGIIAPLQQAGIVFTSEWVEQ